MTTTETIAPVAGLSLDTDPRSWPGGIAVVDVRGDWGPGVELVLESAELQSDGSHADWKPVVRFQADEVRKAAIPPGQYRVHVSQYSENQPRRAWTVDVSPRPRRAKH
jgi:hypothetical protein